ncbi:hypothetical protein AURDEDRAFT_162822 [Auricularia subglabra TFB-10046 SS5]|nr:hypothetical protein AURDEDRAFT_162822 [Auricularia subglabra TFB-10046 SS5]
MPPRCEKKKEPAKKAPPAAPVPPQRMPRHGAPPAPTSRKTRGQSAQMLDGHESEDEEEVDEDVLDSPLANYGRRDEDDKDLEGSVVSEEVEREEEEEMMRSDQDDDETEHVQVVQRNHRVKLKSKRRLLVRAPARRNAAHDRDGRVGPRAERFRAPTDGGSFLAVASPPPQRRNERQNRRVQFAEEEDDLEDEYDRHGREEEDKDDYDLRRQYDRLASRSDTFAEPMVVRGSPSCRRQDARSSRDDIEIHHHRREPREADHARYRDDEYHSDDGGTPPRANNKRRIQRKTSYTPSPKRTKHACFVEGRRAKQEEVFVLDVAREVIEGGMMKYLPLHYLADDIIDQEDNMRVVVVSEEDDKKKLIVAVHERDMSYKDWSIWSDRLIGAMALLRVSFVQYKMYARHFRHIRRAQGRSSNWSTWHLYDIKMRKLAAGKRSPDIGIFDNIIFGRIEGLQRGVAMREQVELNQRTEKLLNELKRAGAPRASTAAASRSGMSYKGKAESAHASTSTSGAAAAKETYEHCLLCGDRSHVFSKEKKAKQPCKGAPIWLIYDKAEDVYKIPGTDAVACWTWNSKQGCNKKGCRLRGHGHRCSLCGSEGHGCHECTKHA